MIRLILVLIALYVAHQHVRLISPRMLVNRLSEPNSNAAAVVDLSHCCRGLALFCNEPRLQSVRSPPISKISATTMDLPHVAGLGYPRVRIQLRYKDH